MGQYWGTTSKGIILTRTLESAIIRFKKRNNQLKSLKIKLKN